ncbi:pilus assembly FimT family protein [Aliterella atlantica]|uniref:Uncharacterized protein n=1 Tax=Aliterella atlantica CENA595 TaxID=1618023 RepID=A0A0D8ZTY8_9CYAN|nr:prepilin-type N-terminal cleavage/methylation domain-containing protein [Aliterella atlantica]KJH72233.1 hypothetical protein UH38_07260 [Aliterella atlantica CENA595]
MNKNLLMLGGQKAKNNEGFTLIELLVIISLIGIMAAFSAPYINFGVNPLKDTTNRVASTFKLMRVKAMSQTSAYRIKQATSTTLKIERNKLCSDSTGWTVDGSFDSEDLTLTEAKDFKGAAKNTVIEIIAATENSSNITPLIEATGSPGWSLCFNSRGLANKTLKLTIKDLKTAKTKDIEIFQGGGVQIYE